MLLDRQMNISATFTWTRQKKQKVKNEETACPQQRKILHIIQ